MEKFKDCLYRPSDDPSTNHENGIVVFTSFVRRDQQGGENLYVEWNETLNRILDSLLSVFANRTLEHTCLSNWLCGFRSILRLQSSEIQQRLVDSNVFYTRDKRIGYLTVIWESFKTRTRKKHGNFLQCHGKWFQHWQTLADAEPKLRNIQILNRRRAKASNPSWNELYDTDFWLMSNVVPHSPNETHTKVLLFVQFIRNALSHFQDIEHELTSAPGIFGNVPYTNVDDLIDTMDRVWPNHFYYVIEMCRPLNILPS